MCVTITGVGSEDIESIGQLKARWIVLEEDLPEGGTDEDCLCGVDVETVMFRANVEYEWDPCGWRVIKEMEF